MYQNIQPPFTLDFPAMTKPELRGYYQWFLGQVPLRIEQLEAFVNQTSQFGSWAADKTPESLVALGEWFPSQISKRELTPSEIEEQGEKGTPAYAISSGELTNRTFSLAVDVGMYFGQVLLNNVPDVSWKHAFGGKRYVDYGQPVLTRSGPGSINPVRIAINFAYGLIGGRVAPIWLFEAYRTWEKNFTKQ